MSLSLNPPKIRELERGIIADPANANSLTIILKVLNNNNESKENKIASLNSLRRIFCHFIDDELFSKINTDDSKDDKTSIYSKWMREKFYKYHDRLISIIAEEDDATQVLAIQIILEFLKRDSKLYPKGFVPTRPVVVDSFKAMLSSLALSQKEIDADLLVMFRQEVLDKHDCIYYCLFTLREILEEVKESPDNNEKQQVIKNLIDLIRIMTLPPEETISVDTFLVEFVTVTNNNKKRKLNLSNGDSENEDDSTDDDEDNNNNNNNNKSNKKVGVLNNKKGNNASINNNKKDKKNKNKSIEIFSKESLNNYSSYKKLFSKCWLLLLSLPLTPAQHKLVLLHLPEHVIEHIEKPLLLSDYLSSSYSCGGIVAVLALESLFVVIVKYNLDYPHFFVSLYNLCSVEVFSAKYRHKFMSLLTKCLRSTNLPAYLVASFIKRLSSLALHSSSHNCYYCIVQIMWLLKQHPQCQVLIHNNNNNSYNNDKFDNFEEKDLNNNNAMNSSLWEFDLLCKHHLLSVSALAQLLKDSKSTDNNKNGLHLSVEEHIGCCYNDLIEKQLVLVKDKKNVALAYKAPTKLFDNNNIINKCFG